MELFVQKCVDAINKEYEKKIGKNNKSSQSDVLETTTITIEDFLYDLANNAMKLNFSTHVPKFNSSESKSSGINILNNSSYLALSNTYSYLSTGKLKKISVDCYGNAAYLVSAKILFLVDDLSNKTLYDYFYDGKFEPFISICRKFHIAEPIILNLIQIFVSAVKNVSNSFNLGKNKQLFFPKDNNLIDDNKGYYLLIPVYSSSLQQELFNLVNFRYTENFKQIKDCYNKNEKCNEKYIQYNDLGRLVYGGTQPQNISYLNSKRAGGSFLISCKPPVYENYSLYNITLEKLNKFFEKNNGTQSYLKKLINYYKKYQNKLDNKEKINKDFYDEYKKCYCRFAQNYLGFVEEILHNSKKISSLPSFYIQYLKFLNKENVDIDDFVNHVSDYITIIISNYYREHSFYLDDELRAIMKDNICKTIYGYGV
jgi:CRISPR type I-F-associated protein Csy1